MNINELLEGESGVIISCDNYILMTHGLVEGTKFSIYKKIPSITSLNIRGSLIAFREKDVQEVYVLRDKKYE